MTMLKAVADFFRSAPTNETLDRYGILSPLLASGEYVTATAELMKVLRTGPVAAILKADAKVAHGHAEKAIKAYKDYVSHLPSSLRAQELANPLSTVLEALSAINTNITQVEDNFQSLFGSADTARPETILRSSSLVVIGYLEKADNYATWLGILAAHLTADHDDLIPPFRTREMLTKARDAAGFAGYNLNTTNHAHSSLLSEVQDMQKKGSDMMIQANDGTWIDEFGHDGQFTPDEQTLMVAAMRSPMLMGLTKGHVATMAAIDFFTNRKDWLTSKVLMEQAKMRGLDETSSEYKRLKKATDHYSDQASKYEQKIERLRG